MDFWIVQDFVMMILGMLNVSMDLVFPLLILACGIIGYHLLYSIFGIGSSSMTYSFR